MSQQKKQWLTKENVEKFISGMSPYFTQRPVTTYIFDMVISIIWVMQGTYFEGLLAMSFYAIAGTLLLSYCSTKKHSVDWYDFSYDVIFLLSLFTLVSIADWVIR